MPSSLPRWPAGRFYLNLSGYLRSSGPFVNAGGAIVMIALCLFDVIVLMGSCFASHIVPFGGKKKESAIRQMLRTPACSSAFPTEG
jgi:hypothetical protein